MRDIVRQIVNVIGTVLLITVNVLANTLPLNGLNTGEFSDRFDVYFVPAGYVFAIWGLIYVALAAFTVYQALPSQRENPHLRRIGYLYALSCVANVAWLFLWHYEQFVWTLAAMLPLLVLLIAIYLRLRIGRLRVPPAETWLVHVPFSIYLGWITVATIANVTQVLDFVNWSGWGLAAEWWAIIMLVVGGVVASLVSLTRGDVAYVLVIVWAFAGIVVKQSDTLSVAITAGVVAGLVLLTLIIGLPLRQERLQKRQVRYIEGGIRDRW
ncbi:MAG: tryptophan-rich sensory protein [Anaerolineae bacterium]